MPKPKKTQGAKSVKLLCDQEKDSGERPRKRKDPNDYLYDPKQKGWRGPIRGQTDTLQVTRIIKQQTQELQNQKKENVTHNRQGVDLEVVSPDLDDDSDTASRIFDISEAPGSDLPKPFTACLREAKYAPWNPPPRPEQHSHADVAWQKPTSNSETVESGYHSTASRLARLQADMVAKQRELDIIKAQLFKSQRENYKLVQQLQACSGTKYDDILKENRDLKVYVDRLVRDNMKLQGQTLRNRNSVIHKREYERYVQSRCENGTRRGSNTQSNSTRNSFRLDVNILPRVNSAGRNVNQNNSGSSNSNQGSSIASSIVYV